MGNQGRRREREKSRANVQNGVPERELQQEPEQGFKKVSYAVHGVIKRSGAGLGTDVSH